MYVVDLIDHIIKVHTDLEHHLGLTAFLKWTYFIDLKDICTCINVTRIDNPSPIYPALSHCHLSHLYLISYWTSAISSSLISLLPIFSPLQFLLCFAAKLNFLREALIWSLLCVQFLMKFPQPEMVILNHPAWCSKPFLWFQPPFSAALALLCSLGINVDYLLFCFPASFIVVRNILQFRMHIPSLYTLKDPLCGPAQMFQQLWSPPPTSSLPLLCFFLPLNPQHYAHIHSTMHT